MLTERMNRPDQELGGGGSMKAPTMVWRSFVHYWKWHVGLAACVAIAAAVIAGALGVGTSVRGTLRERAAERLGAVQSAVVGGDKLFTGSLAQKVGGRSAGVLVARATASLSDKSRRVSNVTVIGVTDAFFTLGRTAAEPAPAPGSGRPNAALAEVLGLAGGERVVLRLEKPSPISKDAPLSGESDESVSLPVEIGKAIPAAAMGDFSLAANQSAPFNIFVPLMELQSALGQPDRINAVLTDQPADAVAVAVDAGWTLADAGLKLERIAAGNGQAWQITTDRVFLEPQISTAIKRHWPEALGVLTYMVNEIRGPGEGVTPYSMATAVDGVFDLGPDEAAVSAWTAEDRGLKRGDKLTLGYYAFNRGRKLETRQAEFTVKVVAPADSPAVRKDWTPNFPGISEAKSCREWKPGLKMDLNLIRPKDEAFWNEFKGTPKVFVSLATGQRLWGNRFGNLTALRQPILAPADEASVEKALRAQLKPADFGLTVAPVGEAAQQAAENSYDLGGLFLAMSGVLILTALLLTALMFLFNIEARAVQIGLLAAQGFRAGRIRRWLVLETVPAALVGAVLGMGGAIFYAKSVLGSLGGAWGGAIGGLKVEPHLPPGVIVGGALGAAVLALAVVWWTARRLSKATPRALLSSGAAALAEAHSAKATGKAKGSGKWRLWAAVGLAALALGLAVTAKGQALGFFGAGAALLTAALLALAAALAKGRAASAEAGLGSVWAIGWRNATRRSGRSLAIAGLLAGGIFLIASMEAFRLDATADAAERTSGTGGFALVGESTLPVYEDLNAQSGWDVYNLDEKDMAGVSVVAARFRAGDEASCLNLNRPQNPHVLGLDAAALEKRGAFSFAGKADWSVLKWSGQGAVPVAMDANYVQYTLKAGLGDTLTVPDDRGGKVELKIAGLLKPGVLQGHAIMDEAAFEKVFPDTGGYRFFLVDAPADRVPAVSKTLTRMLENRGLALESTAARLNRFNAVQNTYLRIFSALGGLGLILSTAGLGLLLSRNVLERRAEFGVLQAVGFRKAGLRRIVVGETALVLVAGVVAGVAAALLAVWPVAGRPAVPVGPLAIMLGAGLLFCWTAAWLALRGPLLDAVRTE